MRLNNCKSVVVISLDTSIAKGELSSNGLRQLHYAKHFDNYVVIIISTTKDRLKSEYHYGNLHIYPTNVFFKPYAILKGLSLVHSLHEEYWFDVITSQDPLATGMIGAISKRLLQIPLNIQMHSTYHYAPGWENDFGVNRLWKKVIDPVLKRADSIRVVNRGLVQQLRSLYPLIAKKIVHIPVMVDLKFFHKRIKKKDKLTNFITVGRLAPEKNHLMLLNAFAKVVTLKPEVQLTIIGDGPMKQTLKQKIKELNLNRYISIVGEADPEGVRDHLHQTDVYISSSNHEGWGSAIIEAMAAGLPVVATKVGCVSDDWLGNDIAKVVSPGNPQEMQEAIVWCLLNPEKAMDMAAKAQTAVLEKLDNKNLENQWIELLQKTP